MDGNDLANPVKYFGAEDFFISGGLTKRELIAAMQMQGLLSNASIVGYKASYAELFETLSEMAEKSADALIERLSADPVAEGVNPLSMYSRELDEGLTDGN
jgi:hypothetical protein